MESQILSAFILPPFFQSINVVIEYVDKILKCEYTPADGDAFLLGTQEEVPTLLLSTCGTDASKRLVIWCERQEEKGGQIEYSDEEAEVQEATDDLAFLDGEFVENETHDFI